MPPCLAPPSIRLRPPWPRPHSSNSTFRFALTASMPTRWFTVKGEAAFFSSSSPATDEYVIVRRAARTVERRMGTGRRVRGGSGHRSPLGVDVRPRSRHQPRVCRTRFLHGRPEPERGSGRRGPTERRRRVRQGRVLTGERPALEDDGHGRGDWWAAERLPRTVPTQLAHRPDTSL